jgi:hypothetical protein
MNPKPPYRKKWIQSLQKHYTIPLGKTNPRLYSFLIQIYLDLKKIQSKFRIFKCFDGFQSFFQRYCTIFLYFIEQPYILLHYVNTVVLAKHK